MAPLTAAEWDDLVDLFGPERGGRGRLLVHVVADWGSRLSGDNPRRTPRAVPRHRRAGPPPGVLAYDDGLAVGWCAVWPRPSLPRLQRSRVAKPTAAAGLDTVFFINCFFIRRQYRRQGMMAALVAAAVELARASGARTVEACPIEPARKLVWGEGFVGLASAFRAAGFTEIVRRSPTRPLMRLDLC